MLVDGPSPRPWGTRLAASCRWFCHGPSPRPWGTLRDTVPAAWRCRSIPTPVGNTARCLPERRVRAVHPHARGEHAWQGAQIPLICGPSPRPWGTRSLARSQATHPRSIPTPVGNTGRRRRLSSGAPVHPHARGEHVLSAEAPTDLRGPSPRPWGTLGGAVAGDVDARSIPTPVGNTEGRTRKSEGRSVHPHARGEHCISLSSFTFASRSIPTPVGNTAVLGTGGVPASVHPHARGEHSGVRSQGTSMRGPSPRPWGTLDGHQPRRPLPVHPHARGEHEHCQGYQVASPGPSPRPWGNTAVLGTGGVPASVHPHARGEHSWSPLRTCPHPGPSPRPWGTRAAREAASDGERSIPTPVGNTRAGSRRSGRSSVHPHARGEHSGLRDKQPFSYGPSPRPWGTHGPPHLHRSPVRSIPTPVGNT